MDKITYFMLHAAKFSDSGRVMTIDDNGTERVYDQINWNELDADTLNQQITMKKHVLVENTLNDDAVKTLAKFYDLQNNGATSDEIDCFWLHENDDAFYVYWFECVYNGRDAKALLNYHANDPFWSCIW